MRLLFATVFFSLFSYAIVAQDYSASGLMQIKEQSEAQRMEWNKNFDEAVQSKDFSKLAPVRQQAEGYLNREISALKRLYAQGDGRSLLTAVSNYLQIEKQFVKDAMVPAESLKADDQSEIEKIYQKITDFSNKEKAFIIEINNALRSEPNAAPPQEEPEVSDDGAYSEEDAMEKEKAKPRRKGKLPHELADEKNGKQENEDEE